MEFFALTLDAGHRVATVVDSELNAGKSNDKFHVCWDNMFSRKDCFRGQNTITLILAKFNDWRDTFQGWSNIISSIIVTVEYYNNQYKYK